MAASGAEDPRIGSLLKGKWAIEARVGSGGVATVYAARGPDGTRVAIKILNRDVAKYKEVRARFRREGDAVNAVDHPGVVRVFEKDATDDGLPFLVMDLLDGELVDDRRIRLGGVLPLPEVIPIAEQLLDVLEASHRAGIVHRDVKPENLFLCKNGTLKLLDFGVAKICEPDSPDEPTAAGVLVGSPEFMSPEQASGVPDAIDPLSDVWSAGATIFALLSGQSVHGAETQSAQLLAAASRRARSLALVVPEAPAPFVAVVDRALAFDKRARWPSASAMRSALAAVQIDGDAAAGSDGVATLPNAPSAAPPLFPLDEALTASRTPSHPALSDTAKSIPRFRPATMPEPPPRDPPWRRPRRGQSPLARRTRAIVGGALVVVAVVALAAAWRALIP